MNRRRVLGLVAGIGALSVVDSTDAATPEAEVTPTCDLDLDASDLTISLRIPSEVPEEMWPGVTSTLSARLWALGWTTCSVSGEARDLLVNLQIPRDDRNDNLDLVAELLTVPGRVDIVDPGESALVVGDRIATSSMVVAPNGPDINVVYGAIVTNADIEAIEEAENVVGEPVARFRLSEEAGARLQKVTAESVGLPLPVVIVGLVVLAPIVQNEIGAEFDLQPVEPELLQRLQVLSAGLPYPAPLEMGTVRDNR